MGQSERLLQKKGHRVLGGIVGVAWHRGCCTLCLDFFYHLHDWCAQQVAFAKRSAAPTHARPRHSNIDSLAVASCDADLLCTIRDVLPFSRLPEQTASDPTQHKTTRSTCDGSQESFGSSCVCVVSPSPSSFWCSSLLCSASASSRCCQNSLPRQAMADLPHQVDFGLKKRGACLIL